MTQLKNDLLVTVFEEMGHPIRYQIIDGNLWICAKDLAKPLGKTKNAITKQIALIPEDEKGVKVIHTLGGDQNITFITKTAALWMINKTNAKPGTLVYKFQWWCAKQLDELLTKGTVSLRDQRIAIFNDFCDSTKHIMFNDNVSKSTRIINSCMVINANAKCDHYDDNKDTDPPMSIENRLILKFGIKDPKIIRSVSISIGKLAKKKYIERYNDTPDIGNEMVFNRVKKGVYIYSPDIYELWIDDLIEAKLS